MSIWFYAVMQSDTGRFSTAIQAWDMGHARNLLRIRFPTFSIVSIEE